MKANNLHIDLLCRFNCGFQDKTMRVIILCKYYAYYYVRILLLTCWKVDGYRKTFSLLAAKSEGY